jgi:hypothetical protein
MDVTWIPRRAVGGVRAAPGVRPPATGLARALVVGMLVLAVPTGGAGPVGAMAPDGPSVRQSSAHSSPEVGRQSLPATGEVQTARIELVARTRRPDWIAADLGEAQGRLAGVDDELALAHAELEARDESADAAGRAVKDARAVRDQAQEAMTGAELIMTGASGRLADLMAASEAAATARADAAARVEGERAGSKAHRAAFTAWQMAAIADRAAHARQVVAEGVGAVAFEKLGALAVTLAEAEIALTTARSERTEAEQSAQESSARLAALEVQRQVLEAEVDALTAEAAEAAGSQAPEPRPTGRGPQ